jgi:hypothetical protein
MADCGINGRKGHNLLVKGEVVERLQLARVGSRGAMYEHLGDWGGGGLCAIKSGYQVPK